MIAFTKENTDDAGKYIVVDGLNGKTVLTDGSTAERSFAYHDHGFIELAPSCPVERDVYISYVSGSTSVTIIGAQISESAIGRYIMVGSDWKKIIDILEGNIVIVNTPAEEDGFEYSNIVTMNEVSIELSAGADLSRLNFVYKPTFQ